MSFAAIPTSLIVQASPMAPVILALQAPGATENWAAFGSTVAAVLLAMWGRDRDWSLMKRAFGFVSAIFGGWSLPYIVLHNLPTDWSRYIPHDRPQTWAICGAILGVVAAQFFVTLFWLVESAGRRARPRLSKALNVIGPDDKNPTDMGTEEQQQEESARYKAKLLKRLERLK